MSSITRVMLGLPFAKGTKGTTKQVKGHIFTRAHMPDGSVECSIVRPVPKDKPGILVKSVIIKGDEVDFYKPGILDYRLNKRTGRRVYY